MINFNFHITNPFSKRWDILISKHGNITKNKAWEINSYATSTILSVTFEISMYTDHAGIRLQFGLLGYEIELHIYDCRHWNIETNSWETYTTLEEYK